MQLDKIKMPSSEAKPLLTAPQTEKPRHYTYLKEFRVEQCPLFLQHKCTQHRPFTCFNWHFMNQRRRRPVRKRDGSFNYSADNYCPKYDETTGICPDGDECPFLHRTAGDTERRYHLRYYKTCNCVHETDNRGYCAKNGAHCAFAHGQDDQRMPVYDIKEIQAENSDGDTVPNGPNVLDKERNLMNEDPKWQDTQFVLLHYKTEQCKRPPRLCRQGYACPQYHNSRDKRRPPRKNKYRSTPCPNVKHGDEWGEPTNCENGDNCSYCHTRTEQQFHPEIYKSTKCNDVQSAGYCPRGVFCAFAHVDQEMTIARELSGPLDSNSILADILHNAAPASRKRNKKSSESSNGSGELSECTSTSSVGSNGSHSKAPGAQLAHRNDNHHQLSSAFLNDSYQELLRDTIGGSLDNASLLGDSDKDKSQNIYVGLNMGNSLLGLQYDMGNALDDMHLDDQNLGIVGMERDYENDSPTISNPISAGLASSGILGSSAPVNIPRSSHSSFSPGASPLQHLQSGFLSANRFSHPDTLESSFLNHVSGNHVNNSGSRLGSLTNSGLYGGDFVMSPSSRPSAIGTGFGVSPSLGGQSSSLTDPIGRKLSEKSKGCENCYHLVDEANRKAMIAEQQRDEATAQAQALKKEVDLLQGSPYLHGLRRVSELKTLSLPTLKSIQAQLRNDLEQVDKEVRLQMDPKCLVCNERNRAVTVSPCNHYVLCMSCVPGQKVCPYCMSQIGAHSAPTINNALQM
ncbi:Zinc finger C-x8-C-x5-C-x3-H type (and similar) [Nesidiocoris tenuis]|uniref:Zinc finger C-x8-C-x5-C-x3-H type (And similar) n=1 Tax=Nesidiocoris tenuis TaxID=355587 RepID=A0ABN7BDT5_9HEMI|nr:Zinc finger C-x8-C-x5-C-x3-H type (and similar) [Nesidiocoris tenuis]